MAEQPPDPQPAGQSRLDGQPGLDGQVALVTGAGRGIGRALAQELSAAGAAVGLMGRRPDPLTETAEACTGPTTVAAGDVTNPDHVARALDQVREALGPVDLLVNNAGSIDAAELDPWAADPDDWWSVIETNLRGPFLLCSAVIPQMLERGGGRVVNVNSGMGMRAVPAYSAYSVSKAALARLTDCLAAALPDDAVRVFDLSPGLVRTDMTTAMPMWAEATPEQWNDVTTMTRAVLAIAGGQADELSGRFLHAGRDDIAGLVARSAAIRAADARALRLRPYGQDDPLG